MTNIIEQLRRHDDGPAFVPLMRKAADEIERLRKVIADHDLCHNLHGKVDARAFADGCVAEQRKLYGCAPDADELARLRAIVDKLPKTADGVLIAPGTTLYAPAPEEWGRGHVEVDGFHPPDPPTRAGVGWYLTEEAARAAAEAAAKEEA